MAPKRKEALPDWAGPQHIEELKKIARRLKKGLSTPPPPIPEEVPPVTGLFRPTEHGACKIDLFEVNRTHAKGMNLGAAYNGHPSGHVLPGTYTKLMVNGEVMMSDTPMERRTNLDVVLRAHGDVFIAGLGLGMILLPILAKPEVHRVLVVEKYKDVVDIVEPVIRKASKNHHKLGVMIDDVITMTLPKRGSPDALRFVFDVIYFDIWPTITSDNLKEIARLKKRFAPFLKRGVESWMWAWMEDDLRKKKRAELRERRELVSLYGEAGVRDAERFLGIQKDPGT